jgi:hypothetical protein
MTAQRYAVVMTRDAYAGVPELLRQRGIHIEVTGEIREFKMLRCARDGVGVMLAMSQPPHWVEATDVRRDLVVVAALGESLFRVWRLGREQRLRRNIIEILRPLAWQGETG